MNRKLLDPFRSIVLPETIEEYLEHGTATSIALNRRGTLLAAGTAEGTVVVWDFGTKGVAKKYMGHASAVTSVCWSRDGRYMASGSEDRNVILWDVLSGAEEARFELPAAVTKLSMSPKSPFLCVVSLADGSAILIDINSKAQKTLPVFDEGEATPGSMAVLNKTGDTVILAQSRGGYLALVDSLSLRCHELIKLPQDVRVEGLSLNRRGNLLLVTSNDGAIRMFEVHRLPSKGGKGCDIKEVAKKLSQLTQSSPNYDSLLGGEAKKTKLLVHVRDFSLSAPEKCTWRSACFSSDDTYVIGASESKLEHVLYIWNRSTGSMERILEGPKEGAAGTVMWHPLRSMLISLSGAGRVLCWARIYSENWSAFAPDFKELEENLEYVEREDEFDWNTPGCTDATSPSKMAKERSREDGDGDEESVDILTMDDPRVMSSDEEDELEGQLHYLPAVIEPDEIRDVPVGEADQLEAGDDAAPAAAADDVAMEEEAIMQQDEVEEGSDDRPESPAGDEDEDPSDSPPSSDEEGKRKSRGGGGKRKKTRR